MTNLISCSCIFIYFFLYLFFNDLSLSVKFGIPSSSFLCIRAYPVLVLAYRQMSYFEWRIPGQTLPSFWTWVWLIIRTSSSTSHRCLKANNFKTRLRLLLAELSSIITMPQFSKAEILKSYQILTLLSLLACNCSSNSYLFSFHSLQSHFCSIGFSSCCFLSGFFNDLLTTHFQGLTTVFSN